MGRYDDFYRMAGQDYLTFDDKMKGLTQRWDRFGYLKDPNMNTSLDYLLPSSVDNPNARWYDSRISTQQSDYIGSNLTKTYRPPNSEPTSFFSDWNMGNTLDIAKIGLGTFNSWLAYKNYREQAKNNRFNRKLGRANYTNAAKAYNENLESKYRTRQVNRGATTSEIDRYLQENEDFRRRLARTTL